MNYLSISRPLKEMKSKIKMRSAFATTVQYSINVYQSTSRENPFNSKSAINRRPIGANKLENK